MPARSRRCAVVNGSDALLPAGTRLRVRSLDGIEFPSILAPKATLSPDGMLDIGVFPAGRYEFAVERPGLPPRTAGVEIPPPTDRLILDL